MRWVGVIIAVCRLLITVASLVAEHRHQVPSFNICGKGGSVVVVLARLL